MKWLFCLFSLSLFAEGFLNENESALFFHQGYVVKKGALNLKETARLESLLDRAIERTLQESHGVQEEQFIYMDGSRAVVAGNGEKVFIKRINGCAGMVPELQEFLCSEKLLRTFFSLLGTNDLEHLIAQIHPKLPGDGVAFAKHRDIEFRKSFDPEWQDILGNGSYAICIIAVDRMTKFNGGLWVDANGFDREKEEEKVWLDLEPGDLLFMHPLLYHGSGSNVSPTEKRRTLLSGFCAFGANHRPYPGAGVNDRYILEEGRIVKMAAPWKELPFSGPGQGH